MFFRGGIRLIFEIKTNNHKKILFNSENFNLVCVNENFNCDKVPVDFYDSIELSHSKRNAAIGLTFMSARTCNMSCKHCFAGEGEYGRNQEKAKLFSFELYKEVVDFFIEKR